MFGDDVTWEINSVSIEAEMARTIGKDADCPLYTPTSRCSVH